MIFLTIFVHLIIEDMKQNFFLNNVLNRGAILGFAMLCSHIFEQCAIVYGGTMGWFSVMGAEMLVVMALYIWMLYRFAKQYSLSVLETRETLKVFSYGQGFSYVVSVSSLAGVIVGLGRYIMHSFVIGHDAYLKAMVTSMQTAINSNPESANLMSNYEPMLKQVMTQPEPGILATIFSSVWSYMLWGAIVGLIIAAKVKREPNLFDNKTEE